MPLGILAGRSDRFRRADHAGARRDADRPGLRVSDADRDPLLGRPGRRRRDDAHLLRSRRRSASRRSGSAASRRTPSRRRRRSARPGCRRSSRCSCRSRGGCSSLGEPDDPLRALDGRDRRADRRPGLGDVVTSGLYSNPALAILAGVAIVIMAIALDRATEAMANRTDPAHRHLTAGKRTGSASSRSRARLESASPSARVRARRAQASGRAGRRRTGCSATCRARSTTCRTRPRSSSTSRIRSGTSSCSTGSCRCESFFVETPWPAMMFGLVVIAFLISRPAPGDHGWRCSP